MLGPERGEPDSAPMSRSPMASALTPTEMEDLLVTLLAGATAKDAEHWRKAIGAVERLPLATNVRSNWRVTPKAGKRDLDTIAKAAEVVRAEHPYVIKI